MPKRKLAPSPGDRVIVIDRSGDPSVERIGTVSWTGSIQFTYECHADGNTRHCFYNGEWQYGEETS